MKFCLPPQKESRELDCMPNIGGKSSNSYSNCKAQNCMGDAVRAPVQPSLVKQVRKDAQSMVHSGQHQHHTSLFLS